MALDKMAATRDVLIITERFFWVFLIADGAEGIASNLSMMLTLCH